METFVRLSKKVLVLWFGRLIIISAFMLFMLSLSELYFHGIYLLLSCIYLSIIIILSLRYKFCSFHLNQNALVINSGLLIRKNQFIIHSEICAVRHIFTPLSFILGLANAVVYCEGVMILFPPLTKAQRLELRLYER